MLEQVNIDGEWREAETEVVARLDLLMARVAELERIQDDARKALQKHQHHVTEDVFCDLSNALNP